MAQPTLVNITVSHCSKSSFFVQKFNFDFPRKLSIFWGWKTRENVVVLDLLAVDNFDFTRKIVKKNLGEKLVKMLGFCQNWILDKNLTFRIVWFRLLYLKISCPRFARILIDPERGYKKDKTCLSIAFENNVQEQDKIS